jgi:hypothetical protein
MEPEGSLSHLQVPTTCLYPKPDQSSPCPIPLSEDTSYYYPPIYALVIQVVSFPRCSPPKPCIHLSSPSYILHAPPISILSIDHPSNIWWGVQIIKLLVMKFSPLPVTSSHLGPNTLLSTLFSKTPQPMFILQREQPCFTPIQNNRQNFVFVYLNLYSFE